MEHTNYKRVEMKALVDSALKCSNRNYGESSNQQLKKHEAYSLKGVGSSHKKFPNEYDDSLTEEENMSKLNYYRIYDCGTLKVVWNKK